LKNNVIFTENYLKVKPSNNYYWLIAILGIIMLIPGIYLMGKAFPADHILFSMGLIFTAGGMFSFLNSKYYKIHVNEEKGFINILDSSIRNITPLRIPISYYSSISIQSRAGSEGPLTYELHFMNDIGSSVFITDFKKKKKALLIGQKLQEIMKVDLFFGNEPFLKIIEKKNRFSGDFEISKPEKLNISIKEDGKNTSLSWRSEYTFYHYILLITIIYGFFHVFNFAIMPTQQPGALKYILYGFLALLTMLLLSVITTNALGRFHLHISPGGINYYRSILGKWIGFREMTRGDIALIKNSLNTDDETIGIMSQKGLETINRVISEIRDDESFKPDFSMVSDIFSLKDETIDVNASSLTIADRIFIEQCILKIM